MQVLTFTHATLNAQSIMESSYMMGILMGPSIGGAMYQLLGFPAPFLLVATAAAILSVAFPLVLSPDSQHTSAPVAGNSAQGESADSPPTGPTVT